MAYGESRPSLLALSLNYRRVPGLRNVAPPSDCKVYQANPDGTKGKLLRTETADTRIGKYY